MLRFPQPEECRRSLIRALAWSVERPAAREKVARVLGSWEQQCAAEELWSPVGWVVGIWAALPQTIGRLSASFVLLD